MTKAEFYRNARTDLPGPMASVRVVEATTTLAGPLCAATLADLGADVIMFLQLAAKADIVSPWHRRCVSPSDLSQRSNTGIRIDIVCAQKRGVCGSNVRWRAYLDLRLGSSIPTSRCCRLCTRGRGLLLFILSYSSKSRSCGSGLVQTTNTTARRFLDGYSAERHGAY